MNAFKDFQGHNTLQVFCLRCIPRFSSEANCNRVTPIPWKWPAAVTDELFFINIVIDEYNEDSSTQGRWQHFVSQIIVKGFDSF